MERIIRFSLLLCLFSLFVSIPSYAQKKKRKKANEEYFDESGGFKHRLWYGGSLGLNFTNSYFNVGISPMVGYKVNNWFSAGPRFKIDYTSRKLFNRAGQAFNLRTTSWGVGVFTRAKVITNAFAHIEFEYENRNLADLDANGFVKLESPNSKNVKTVREQRSNFYLGAGYSSGEVLSYEILLLYNVLEKNDSAQLPWDLRFGFTYNF